MDTQRIKQLAGLQSTPEPQSRQRLLETVQLSGDETLETLQQRLDACKRALGIANTLEDPLDRKKWVKAVFVNLNKIRGALQRIINSME